ncbi:MAG: BON domain-containing protein [Thermoguttaceae bacterium]|nr:BON domain-containing protein [Thermoguttaceae bacterium]
MERESKRGRARKERKTTRFATVATVGAFLTASASVGGVAWGQVSTANAQKGATSVLESTRPNGRIGGTEYRGTLAPSAKPEESRFSSGTVRGSAGNIVGVDASRVGGRFVGASDFRSKQNFELFRWRNEILRTKTALRDAERAVGGSLRKPDEPRLVTAKEPEAISLSAWRGGVRYGRTVEEIEAAKKAELAATRAGGTANLGAEIGASPSAPFALFGAPYDPETIWMRGRAPLLDPFAPLGSAPISGGFAPENVWNAPVDERGWVELDGRVRSEFAGASLAPTGTATDLTPLLAPPPSPEEKRRAYQEHLTTRLLQTPEVNPLSPISVEYRDGVATIRGIVPTPSAREAAGRVLLAEPDVRRVENQLTFVRPDGDGLGERVPVAPLPGTKPETNAPLAPTPTAPGI